MMLALIAYASAVGERSLRDLNAEWKTSCQPLFESLIPRWR